MICLISLTTSSVWGGSGGGGGPTGLTTTVGLSTMTGLTAWTSAAQASCRPLLASAAFGAASNSSTAAGSRRRLSMKEINASATVATGVLIVDSSTSQEQISRRMKTCSGQAIQLCSAEHRGFP